MRVISYRRVADLDGLLRSFLEERKPEPDGPRLCFVVPSRRDRDWWRARSGLSDYGLSQEKEAYLWNWEDLYNELALFLALPPLRQIDPPDHRLVLSHITAGFLKEQDKELLKLWPGLTRSGFIDILSDDVRELINEAVSAEQLAVTADKAKPISAVLPELYARYTEYLRKNKLLDSAQLPLAALGLLEMPENQEAVAYWTSKKIFVFTGFMSFTHGQLKLLRKLEELCRHEPFVLKPATGLRNFQDASLQFHGKTWEDEPAAAPGTAVSLTAADSGQEQEMIARLLALWSGGKGALNDLMPFPGFGSIGLSVPERRWAAATAALRRYRVPYSPARGRSVAQSLLGTSLRPMWSVWSQGLEPYETALLLAQPYLAGALSVDGAVRAGPRGVDGWTAYLERLEKTADAPEAKKHARCAVRAFKAMTLFCGALEKNSRGISPAGLFEALHAFLTTPGLWADALSDLPDPSLDDSLRELSASIAEAEDKRLALRELQPNIGPAGDILLKGVEAVGFLESWAEETLVQPSPPLSGSVRLYAGPPPILASHPVWIMTDVTQKNWPGAIRSSPLLDAPERDAMAAVSAYLPSLHDKHVQKEALFRRLIQTGDVLTVLSRSAADEEGRPVSAPSFTQAFFSDMNEWKLKEIDAAAAAEKFFFPAIEAADTERAERAAPFAAAPRGELKFPVSDLRDLLDCPFRYWLKRHARLKERSTSLFSEAEAGSLTHKIWENVWRRRQMNQTEKTEEAPESSILSLAMSEWEKALALTEDYSPRFERLLKDSRLIRHRKNIRFYIERLARVQQEVLDRLSALGVRHDVHTEMELPPLQVDGVTFTGRCDRAEIFSKFNESFAVIIDYKWGKGASYEKKLDKLAERRHLPADLLSGLGDSFKYGLQLSAYALMYSVRHRVAGVGFLCHKDGEIAGTFEPPAAECYLPGKKINSTLEDRTQEAVKAMRCAAAILKSNRYEPCYIADSCRFCDMRGVCRKGELRGDVLFAPEDDGDV